MTIANKFKPDGINRSKSSISTRMGIDMDNKRPESIMEEQIEGSDSKCLEKEKRQKEEDKL